MQSKPWASPFNQEGFQGGGSHTPPPRLSQRAEAIGSRGISTYIGTLLGAAPTQHLRVPEGCPRRADPPRRVFAGPPTPPPPLTGTVRVRDVGPGLADTTPRAMHCPWPLGSRRPGAERQEQAARAEQQAEAAAARTPQAHPPSPPLAPRDCGACARARPPPRASGSAPPRPLRLEAQLSRLSQRPHA